VRLVVVGASLAGLRAAQAARAAGHDGELVVVGEERHPPYTRPPLSKELLQGAHDADACAFPADDLDVTWRLGETATGLDLAAREVALAGGERLAFDALVIATGCRARPWTGPGAELEGVHTIRRLDDAIALRAALTTRPAPRLAIVGAGFIGCEVAASARGLGVDVTLIDVAPQPMPALGPLLGEHCARMHREHGVDLRLGAGIAALRGDGRVEAVELEDGTRVEADVVVVALGALPNTEWLAGSGLTLDPGVACDAHLAAVGTSGVYAAGDVASWPHPLAGGERIRVEHWTNAAEQGTIAGRHAVAGEDGERAPHVAVPSFWSDQYDAKIQAIGLPRLARHVEVVEAAPEGDRFVAVGERDGRVVAALAVNGARRLPWYRRRVAEGITLDALRAELADDPKAFGPAPAREAAA